MNILIAAALLGAPALAGPDDAFCVDVRRLAAGAEESPAFGSLRADRFRPRLLAGYCFFSSAGGYTCGQNLAPRGLTRESLAARIRICLPGATITTDRDYLRHQLIVRHGRFRATVVEHGTDRSHVGRIINIYVAAEAVSPR